MRWSLTVLVLFTLALNGCGGGSETTAQDAQAEPQEGNAQTYVEEADRICVGMVAESRRMAVRFSRLSDPGLSALALTTKELVAPALPILERSAGRMRVLAGRSDILALESYASLYDPIVAVVRERVRAGEAGDEARAHALELQMLDLSALQRKLAREAGLQSCDIDFIHTFATSGQAR